MNRSTFEAELESNGRLIYPNAGVSMMQLLRQDRDLMIIEKPKGRLKRYDGALYVRKDGKYIMHRVLKVRENDYVICGDNCIKKERGITDAQIIGVLRGVIRDGKEISESDKKYRLYVHIWCDLYYLRVSVLFSIKAVRALWRRIKKVFVKK